jgi:N-methylhydantoinase B/oxoprolinase/acetone carboxylase alpha subunit
MSPGSMPLATEIYQEGLRLPPVRLMTAGKLSEDILQLFLANTRVVDERRGDLLAQLAALRLGQQRVSELVERNGRGTTQKAMTALQDYSERLMSAALRRLPAGRYEGEDWMDDDGTGTQRIRIRVVIHLRGGRAVVDFGGTAAQVSGGVNANEAVTLAAVLYVFQCLAGATIPANAGLMRRIGDRAARHPRQCTISGGRRRRQCRDVAAHRRRRFQGHGESSAGVRASGEQRFDEQRGDWRIRPDSPTPVRVLRNHRRRSGGRTVL